jgi:fumarate reductase subunit C
MPEPGFRPLHQRLAHVLRESASLFIVGYAIFLMVVLALEGQGREAFGTFFRQVLQSQLSLVLHLIVLAFAVIHSVASFYDMGKAMVILRGEQRARPDLVAEIGCGICIIVSMLIFLGLIAWSQAFEMRG